VDWSLLAHCRVNRGLFAFHKTRSLLTNIKQVGSNRNPADFYTGCARFDSRHDFTQSRPAEARFNSLRHDHLLYVLFNFSLSNHPTSESYNNYRLR
jgi:hypothetical protein